MRPFGPPNEQGIEQMQNGASCKPARAYQYMTRPTVRVLLATSALAALVACNDFDLRGDLSGAFDTSDAVRVVTAPRPEEDSRGVISYPGYQVVVARRGDTVADVAARIGLKPDELARFNGIPDGTSLRAGEIIALPGRVSEPSPATGASGVGPIRPESVDINQLAGSAIERAEASETGASAAAVDVKPLTGTEPIRHKVQRGETAFSIARLYGVPLQSLAEWNGLGRDYSLREGQFLLIPIAEVDDTAPQPPVSAPGGQSRAPEPPSASQPLPKPESASEAKAPTSPGLSQFATESGKQAQMVSPVKGQILRDFRKGRSDGIDIAVAAGTPVRAAAAGTVAAVTRDTDGIPILVLRHSDGLLTVYAGLDDLGVKKGDVVTRGQSIAKVRSGDPAFLHFEVRKGLEAVDPTPFLTP